ncbi:MAG: hypothetical protein HC900_05655 [Methylacidiphilales bacterium]|nr:hypothetical protein [Candidatus Methylacidiphilales bacterium]
MPGEKGRVHMAESRYRYPAEGHDDTQRAGSATGRSDRIEDPLAELARLIGQEDPFKDFDRNDAPPPPAEEEPFRATASAASQRFERPTRPAQAFGAHEFGKDEYARSEHAKSEHARSEHARSEFERQDYSTGGHAGREPARIDSVASAAYASPAVAAPATRVGAAEASYRREDPYRRHDDVAEYDRDYGAEEPAYEPYYSEDGHMPPHGEGLDELPQRNRSRLILMLMGGVIGLAAVGTGAVFGYRALVGGGEPPTIKAEAGPNKVASLILTEKVEKTEPNKDSEVISNQINIAGLTEDGTTSNHNVISSPDIQEKSSTNKRPSIKKDSSEKPASNESNSNKSMNVDAKEIADRVELISEWKSILSEEGVSINYDSTTKEIKKQILSCYYPKELLSGLNVDSIDGFWLSFVTEHYEKRETERQTKKQLNKDSKNPLNHDANNLRQEYVKSFQDTKS